MYRALYVLLDAHLLTNTRELLTYLRRVKTPSSSPTTTSRRQWRRVETMEERRRTRLYSPTVTDRAVRILAGPWSCDRSESGSPVRPVSAFELKIPRKCSCKAKVLNAVEPEYNQRGSPKYWLYSIGFVQVLFPCAQDPAAPNSLSVLALIIIYAPQQHRPLPLLDKRLERKAARKAEGARCY